MNQSLVTSVVLQITTTGVAGSPVVVKNYQVVVQVSCLGTAGVPVTCSAGSAVIPLPSNLNGAQATLNVVLNPAIDPETTEIDDLSYIVTGSPVSSTASGVIAVTPNATPSLSVNGTATLQATLISYGGFAGNVTMSPLSMPDGGILTSANVILQSGGKANVTLQLNDNLAPTGNNIITASVTDACPPACLALFSISWIITHICEITTTVVLLVDPLSVTIHTDTGDLAAPLAQGVVITLCGADDVTISENLMLQGGLVGPSPTVTSPFIALPGPTQLDLATSSICGLNSPGTGTFFCRFDAAINATFGSQGFYTLFVTATANGVIAGESVSIALTP